MNIVSTFPYSALDDSQFAPVPHPFHLPIPEKRNRKRGASLEI
jgi:hypothetical protein